MSASNLARWGGLSAVAGGIFLIIWAFLLILIFNPTGVPGSLYRLYVALDSFSWLLLIGGLVGLYARQANASGWLDAAGLALASSGGSIMAVLSLAYAEQPMPGPYSWGDGSGRGVAVLLWEAGLLLLGLATLRARTPPLPWKALPLAIFLIFPLSIAATPLMLGAGLESEFFYSGVPRVLTGIGWVLLGYALWSESGEDARQPAAV